MTPREEPCAVPGCENKRSSTLICNMHYHRKRKYGSYGLPPRPSLEERFWGKVDRRGPDDCWAWVGASTLGGYGVFSVDRKPGGAHRFSWQLANGQTVPPKMDVCHTCDNPPCVNPAHLFIGTRTDNMRDMKAKGRAPFVDRTHCVNGHEYTPENTGVRNGGGKRCRTCKAAAQRRYNQKRVRKSA